MTLDPFACTDVELAAAARTALRCWIMQAEAERPLPLHRFLGIGDRHSARLALRDALVREAAALTGGQTRGRRAELLAGHVKQLNRKWRLWRDLGEPPAHAAPVLQLLWRAQHLMRLPTTARRLVDII